MSNEEKTGRLVTLAVACIIVGAILASVFEGNHPLERERAPGLVATFVAGDAARRGQRFDLSAYRGKVVLLDFWATWCPPCRESIPILARLAHRYRDRGVEVIGVDTEGALDPATLALRFDALGGTFPCVQDLDGSWLHAFGVQGLPTLFVVDQTGVIRKVHVGVADESALEREIDRLIK